MPPSAAAKVGTNNGPGQSMKPVHKTSTSGPAVNRLFTVSSSKSPPLNTTAGPRHGTGKIAYRNELTRSETLAAAWRDLLPKNVLVCAGPILEEHPALTNRERASAGPVGEERLRELKSGRRLDPIGHRCGREAS